MSLILNGDTGVQFNDSSLQGAAASPYVLKNRIINGAMDIAQRGTSISVTGPNFTYTLDRFALYSTNTTTTVSQNSSVPTGFLNSIKIQRPNGNTGTNSINFTQTIESKNCYDLSNQSVTFSFWAKAGANYSASGSTLGVQVVTGTVADQGASLIFGSWTGSAAPVNTSTAITTTWTRYTFTGTFGSGVLEAGFVLYWTGTGTAGADDAVYVTGVQLEIGTSATPFERRLIGTELALCQRYYERVGVLFLTSAWASVANTLYWKVTKRTTPTLTYTLSSGSGGTFSVTPIGANDTSMAFQNAGNSVVTGGEVFASSEL